MTDNQTLQPPQGPEYARCFGCGHIEPEHRPGTGPCLVCACAAYRPVPVVPVSSPPPDQTALRDRIAEVLWPLTDWDGDQLNAERAADAVLAVLPPPADRAAVLLWAADQIDAETRQAKADGVLEPDKFRPCRDASAQLRRLAGCQECASGLEHDVHCPTPESHNWGCGCPTNPVPADGPSRLAAEAQQPDTTPACTCGDPNATFVPLDGWPDCPQHTPEPLVHKGGNADDCPACQAQGLHTIGHPYECPGSEK